MNIGKLIGNTPMIKIVIKYKEKIVNVFVKLEYYNYTGSIKDRIAYYIINESYKDRSLEKGMPIIEATSGNTGISFAALGAFYNHPVHIFMPDWVSKERINIMKMYGAKVYLVSKEEGGFKEAIKRADNLAKEIRGFRPNQFDNVKNVEAHYFTTGKEIVNTLKSIDSFVSGIGTGGTLIGIGKKIKDVYKDAKVIALEPAELPIITKGIIKGTHKIEGIGDDFIPSIVDMNIIDKVVTISDIDAINMSRILARKYGLGVGISSGANLIASVITANNNDNVVTVFPDDLKKYLSTELSKDIDYDNKLISNHIQIISLQNV